jgi:hypothetical protein
VRKITGLFIVIPDPAILSALYRLPVEEVTTGVFSGGFESVFRIR